MVLKVFTSLYSVAEFQCSAKKLALWLLFQIGFRLRCTCTFTSPSAKVPSDQRCCRWLQTYFFNSVREGGLLPITSRLTVFDAANNQADDPYMDLKCVIFTKWKNVWLLLFRKMLHNWRLTFLTKRRKIILESLTKLQM